jgi:hypothetical protein
MLATQASNQQLTVSNLPKRLNVVVLELDAVGGESIERGRRQQPCSRIRVGVPHGVGGRFLVLMVTNVRVAILLIDVAAGVVRAIGEKKTRLSEIVC